VHTWWRLIHEVELQSLLGFLGEQRLVGVQLLLTVILRPDDKQISINIRVIFEDYLP
jgi:hypothetical protein